MTRMPASERRGALIAAAFRVLARDGVDATTTRAIVAEAGMPLGAFHYCFRSKEELLRELTGVVVAEEVAAAAAVLQPGTDVCRALRAGLRAYWAHVETEPERHQALYELTQYALRRPGLEDLPRMQYACYQSAAEDVLRLLGEHAGLRWAVPVPVAARMLVTVVDGLTLSWLVDRDSTAALAALDAFADALAALATPTVEIAAGRRAG